MPVRSRLALPALCLSLILPCALPSQAAEAPPKPEQAPAAKAPERQPLAERSQDDAVALERQLPEQEQQQLQAGSDTFLALWKPANTSDPHGAVILIPGAGESADWPDVIGPLRRKLPDAQWHSLSLTLPDLQSQASEPRLAEAEKTTDNIATSSKNASTAAPKPIEQAASAEASDTRVEPFKTDAQRIFARIDAAIAYAQQQNARSIVLLGHGTGGYWAARYLSEKPSPLVQKLVLVTTQTPPDAGDDVAQMTANLKLATADFFYSDNALARQTAEQRLRATQRQKASNFHQVSLHTLPGNSAAEQEQLFRRVRGWLNPQPVDN